MRGDFTVGQIPKVRLFYQLPLRGGQFGKRSAQLFTLLLQVQDIFLIRLGFGAPR